MKRKQFFFLSNGIFLVCWHVSTLGSMHWLFWIYKFLQGSEEDFLKKKRFRGSLCDFDSSEHEIADDLVLISTTILIVSVTFGGPLWFPVNYLWSWLLPTFSSDARKSGSLPYIYMIISFFFPGITQLVTSHHKKIGKHWKPCISKRLTESGNRTLRV